MLAAAQILLEAEEEGAAAPLDAGVGGAEAAGDVEANAGGGGADAAAGEADRPSPNDGG